MNPNICQIYHFKNVKLPEDPLYLPIFELYVFEQGYTDPIYSFFEPLMYYASKQSIYKNEDK